MGNTLGPVIAGIPTGTVSGCVLVAVVVLALVKSWPALKKLQMEEDGALRGDLLARITRLEEAVSEERRSCTEQLAEMRRDYEARLAAQGRQIDGLQRELFILRAAAARLTRADDLEAIAQKFDEGEAG